MTLYYMDIKIRGGKKTPYFEKKMFSYGSWIISKLHSFNKSHQEKDYIGIVFIDGLKDAYSFEKIRFFGKQDILDDYYTYIMNESEKENFNMSIHKIDIVDENKITGYVSYCRDRNYEKMTSNYNKKRFQNGQISDFMDAEKNRMKKINNTKELLRFNIVLKSFSNHNQFSFFINEIKLDNRIFGTLNSYGFSKQNKNEELMSFPIF